VAHLVQAAYLPGLQSLPLVSFPHPFFGCFLFIKFGRVSSVYLLESSDGVVFTCEITKSTGLQLERLHSFSKGPPTNLVGGRIATQ